MDLYDVQLNDPEALYSLLVASDDHDILEIKAAMQQWFNSFPANHQEGLKRRFTSKDRRHHIGAFFELYIYQYISSLGFAVECLDNDSNAEKTPDFLVSKNGVQLFYLECTICADSDAATSDEKKQNLVIKWIESAGLSGFDVFLEFSPRGTGTPNKIEFLHFIKNQTFPSSLEDQKNLHWDYRSDNLSVRIKPIPNSGGDLQVTGWAPNAMGYSGGQDKILRVLKRKAQKQKTTIHKDLPYLIAVNVSNDHVIGDTSHEDFIARTVLFGSYSVNMGSGTGSHALSESFLFDDRSQPTNTGVSAILWWQNLMPWNYRKRSCVLWHHPFAANPLGQW